MRNKIAGDELWELGKGLEAKGLQTKNEAIYLFFSIALMSAWYRECLLVYVKTDDLNLIRITGQGFCQLPNISYLNEEKQRYVMWAKN